MKSYKIIPVNDHKSTVVSTKDGRELGYVERNSEPNATEWSAFAYGGVYIDSAPAFSADQAAYYLVKYLENELKGKAVKQKKA